MFEILEWPPTHPSFQIRSKESHLLVTNCSLTLRQKKKNSRKKKNSESRRSRNFFGSETKSFLEGRRRKLFLVAAAQMVQNNFPIICSAEATLREIPISRWREPVIQLASNKAILWVRHCISIFGSVSLKRSSFVIVSSLLSRYKMKEKTHF